MNVMKVANPVQAPQQPHDLVKVQIPRSALHQYDNRIPDDPERGPKQYKPERYAKDGIDGQKACKPAFPK